MIVDEGLELLTEEQAWALLRTSPVGRIGLVVDGVPLVLPVNFDVVDNAILFHTSPGAKLAAAERRDVVAFEVDDFGPADRSGWSVLAVGIAELVSGDGPPTTRVGPYVDGARPARVRIVPTFISGRRIVHGPDTAA